MITVLDIECTFTGSFGSGDATPYNANNRLVSVGYKTNTGLSEYLFFHHKEMNDNERQANIKKLQQVLDSTDMLVGHNLKFDYIWLVESGFKYDKLFYDTMIFEYVNARGIRKPLSLAEITKEYGFQDKGDILHKYCGELGLSVSEIPSKELAEYGMGDVEITYNLYHAQVAKIKSDPLISSMKPVLKLMNEFLPIVAEMERNGAKIDVTALDEVEAQFRAEYNILEERLKELTTQVMGHTPINLASPEQLSWVLYSRKVKDKELWANTFNLGTELKNGVVKQKYPTRHTDAEFSKVIREQTTLLRRTIAKQCSECGGKGYIQKYNKDGSPSKRLNVCHTCHKTGLIYEDTPHLAGLKIKPISYEHTSVGGFGSSKETIDELLQLNISDEAREFLTCLKRYNAISTYLTSFVEGIRKNIADDGLLHCNLNQTITATGRLSSSNPNLQNQPRSGTFPIRRVFVSRFDGGKVLEVDWSGLEFRTAVALSGDLQGKHDIDNKEDIHQFTADTISKYGQPTTRQEAKAHTFKPLFAGMSGTEAEIKYYEEFNKKYAQIHAWQDSLVEYALKHKHIQSPSGRVYAFPFVERLRGNRVRNQTQIYNYCIQGFATGDLMPCTLIEISRELRKYKSVLFLTVHDSVLIDVHPDEIDIIPQVIFKCFDNIEAELKRRFNFESIVKFAYEAKMGDNWLNAKVI
jgi:DNA polymerase I-like protein with 3'-5' exonuclease and polymerase domains